MMTKITKYHATNHSINPKENGNLLKVSDVVERLDHITDDESVVLEKVNEFIEELEE